MCSILFEVQAQVLNFKIYTYVLYLHAHELHHICEYITKRKLWQIKKWLLTKCHFYEMESEV